MQNWLVPPEVADQPTTETLRCDAWYKPGPTIKAFHKSNYWVRFLIGARGAGKTASTAGVEAVKHCWYYAGAKVLVVRKTEVSQGDTTVETLANVFAKLGPLYQETELSLFRSWNDGRTIRLPSAKALEEYNRLKPTWRTKGACKRWLDGEGSKLCGFIEMRGLPSSAISENKLRGFECSLMIMIEADMLTVEDFRMALPCLRWAGSDGQYIQDGGIILETNPPDDEHWIAKMEEEWRDGKHPNFFFWHIATEENRQNLPPNYIESLKAAHRGNPAMYDRMVLGKYAHAYDGDPVFFAFKPEFHVGENLPWPKGAYLVRSSDVGTHNSTIFSAYWLENGSEYWHVLKEIYLENSDTERQARAILAVTDDEFPFFNDRGLCAGVLDFCDPAAANSNYSTEKTASSLAVFRSYGIFPGVNLWQRGLQIGLAVCNRLLELKDAKAGYCFRIDRKGAPTLFRAMMGGYRYPSRGENGYGNNEPLKGLAHQRFDFSHSADSWRYGILNTMKLLRAEFEPLKKSNRARNIVNPNPPRNW